MFVYLNLFRYDFREQIDLNIIDDLTVHEKRYLCWLLSREANFSQFKPFSLLDCIEWEHYLWLFSEVNFRRFYLLLEYKSLLVSYIHLSVIFNKLVMRTLLLSQFMSYNLANDFSITCRPSDLALFNAWFRPIAKC